MKIQIWKTYESNPVGVKIGKWDFSNLQYAPPHGIGISGMYFQVCLPTLYNRYVIDVRISTKG